MLLDPRNGTAWDLPAPGVPRRSYVVASLPRTGSTLLCRSLWETGVAGAPKEYLNPMQIRDWEARLAPRVASRLLHRPLRGPLLALAGRGRWDEARLRGYLGRILARRTGPNGLFGLKIHHHHFQRFFGGTGLDPEELLGPIRWLYITRGDKLAQAVSWARALRTGRWASTQPALLPAVYDRAAITRRLEAIAAGEAGWERWFAPRGIAPLRLTYEELVADHAGTVRRALEWLDVADPDVQIPVPSFERQADGINQEWIARYRGGR